MEPELPKQSASADASKSGGRRHATLLALGSATVISIYSAGFVRTRAAASRIESASESRRQPAHEISALPESVSSVVAMRVADSTPPVHKAPVKPAPTAAAPVIIAAQPPVPAEAPVPAPVAPVTAAPVDTIPAPRADTTRAGWKDGSYTGWGTSRHGDIEATVEIKGGRIISANISQCRTRYSCSRIADLPPQVLTRQSAEVDYVSGATQSSDAYYYAVLEALKKAK